MTEVPAGRRWRLSEFVVFVPGTAWFLVPNELSDAVAASANCATATAAALLRYVGDVAGSTVLVLGAGVLGVTAVAMARAAGAGAVLVADPVPELRERALAFGATQPIQADTDEMARSVLDVTRGRGADAVIELAGTAGSVQTAIRIARTGGTVILAGTVTPTPAVPSRPRSGSSGGC